MATSILRDKSYRFALQVVSLYKKMISENKEYVLSKQLLKSGTSIGALIHEAEFAQSRLDFISKLAIALKESNETDYWISLLCDSSLLSAEIAMKLKDSNNELKSMLISSIKTAKNNPQSK